jgi:hypothetical protein
LIYKVRWRAYGSSKPMLTLVEAITPEAAMAQVEQLNSDFSRFDRVIQVQNVAGEVVLNCPSVTQVPQAMKHCRPLSTQAA